MHQRLLLGPRQFDALVENGRQPDNGIVEGPLASISWAVDRALFHHDALVVGQLSILDDVLGYAAVAPLLVVLKALGFDLLLDAFVIVA
jgi:hypothetical protein